MDERNRPPNEPRLSDAPTPSNQSSVVDETDDVNPQITGTARLSEPSDAVKKYVYTAEQVQKACETHKRLLEHNHDDSEKHAYLSSVKNRIAALNVELVAHQSARTPELGTLIDRVNTSLASSKSTISSSKELAAQFEQRLRSLKSERDEFEQRATSAEQLVETVRVQSQHRSSEEAARWDTEREMLQQRATDAEKLVETLQQRVTDAENLVNTVRDHARHRSSEEAALWDTDRKVLQQRASDAEKLVEMLQQRVTDAEHLVETVHVQPRHRSSEEAARWDAEREMLQQRATDAEKLAETAHVEVQHRSFEAAARWSAERDTLLKQIEAAECQFRVLQERQSLMQQSATQTDEFEPPAPPTVRPLANAIAGDNGIEEDSNFQMPLPDEYFHMDEETQHAELPDPNPPKRKGGRPASRKQKIAKIEPLAAVVRDRSGDGWTSPQDLSPLAFDALKTQNKELAQRKSSFEGYTKMVTKRALSVSWCVQCDLVSHARAQCGLNGANTACGRCVKSKRACSKLIELEGELKMAWLPLEEELRDENVSWTELPYWQVPVE